MYDEKKELETKEKEAEKKAVEKYLGINNTPKPVAVQPAAAPAPTAQPQQTVEVRTTVEEVAIPVKPEVNTVTKDGEAVALVTTTETVKTAEPVPQNIVPDVSSPF